MAYRNILEQVRGILDNTELSHQERVDLCEEAKVCSAQREASAEEPLQISESVKIITEKHAIKSWCFVCGATEAYAPDDELVAAQAGSFREAHKHEKPAPVQIEGVLSVDEAGLLSQAPESWHGKRIRITITEIPDA